MTGLICNHFVGEINTVFCGLTFLGRKLVRDFGGIGGIRSLRIFSKPSAISGFGLSLPNTV